MQTFKDYIYEREDVWRDTGYNLSKDDIESAKKMAKMYSSKPSDELKKEITKVKTNLARWEKQSLTMMTPYQRRKLDEKIREARIFLRNHQ